MLYSRKKRKASLNIIVFFLMSYVILGCSKTKDNHIVDEINQVSLEFDISNSVEKASGKNYPILAELELGSGVHTYKVNLKGGTFTTRRTFKYRVLEAETTALEGWHFKFHDEGQFVIEANKKEGEISIEILDFPIESGSAMLVLELIDADEVKVDEKHGRIGIPILLTLSYVDETRPLHEVFAEDQLYNTIYIDPLNPNLPLGFRQRFAQAIDNMAVSDRVIQHAYLHFGADNVVTFVAPYFYSGAAGSMITRAYIRLKYEFEQNGEAGVGKFVYKEAIANGARRTELAPILEEYLEKYEFKLDWVDESIANPPRSKTQLGGLFGVGEDSEHYFFGLLQAFSDPVAENWPIQSSPVIFESFIDKQDDLFNALLIDPEASFQSDKFRILWNEAKISASLSGVQLYKLMFYFNPSYNFHDVILLNFYRYGGTQQRTGQIRFDFKVGYDGYVQPFIYYNQDDRGSESRITTLVDDLLTAQEFKMQREGSRVRFTDKSDGSFFFEGELMEVQNVTEFWPE